MNTAVNAGVQAAAEGATANTAAVITDPAATALDRYEAALAEEAAYAELEPGPCDRQADAPEIESAIDYSAEIGAEIEAELEAAI
jgi:hypothetical protein